MRCFSGIEETLRPMLHSFHESIPIVMHNGSRNLAGRVVCDENTGECPHPVLRDG